MKIGDKAKVVHPKSAFFDEIVTLVSETDTRYIFTFDNHKPGEMVVDKDSVDGYIEWDIEKMTIDEVREKFMAIVYDELSDDSDNCRANRIIDAADEYVEEIMKLGCESNET